MKEKNYTLLEPIKGHNGLITEVKIKEPAYRDYMSLGDPFVWARTADGVIFPAENAETIAAYLEKCVVEPDAAMMKQVGLADAMAIKEILLGFFSTAKDKTSPSPSAS